MKDVNGKEAQLGNDRINSAVRKAPGIFEPEDIIPQFLPGDRFGELMKDRIEIVQISADISGIRNDGVIGETAKGDHLPEMF